MSFRSQQGYFLIVAIIFIFVIGLMGGLIAYTFSNRALLSVAQQRGQTAFYIAESGLEIGARLLSKPVIIGALARIACANLEGTASVTNAAIASGTFTLTTVNSSPIFARNTLNGAITSSATTITVTSAAAFAPSGRIVIDNEAIDYASISGNSFVGVTRGVAGTVASSHANTAPVGQYQCSIDSQAGIPNLTSPSYKRELQMNVQLQDGWVVGNAQGSNFNFFHWNYPTEEAWNAAPIAGGGATTVLNAVSMLSNGDGWAVADVSGSNLNFLRWNGSTWTLMTLAGACGTQDLYGVSAISSQEAWAVGGRYRPACAASGAFRYNILKWNGSTWTLLTPSTTPSLPADTASVPNLNAVSMRDTTGDGTANIGFAVGDSGTILRYNGTNWAVMTSPTTRNLTGVYTVSTSEAWAVGLNGTILKYNGTSWSSFTSPTSTNLNAISMIDTDGNGVANAGWAVGNSGVVLYYNGSTWTFTDLGVTSFFGVDIFDTQDVWVVGASGTLEHWDGSAWTEFDTGASQALNAISVVRQIKNPASAWKQIYR